LTFSNSKPFGPFCAVAPLRWAVIAMPARAAVIRLSRTTRAEIGTAPSVRRKSASAGWRHENTNSSTPATFTLSSPCLTNSNVLALENPRLFYDLLFTASAQTLLEIAIDRKHLGAEIGMISILHTWGQNLLLNPHS
jgi:hypothetical protein